MRTAARVLLLLVIVGTAASPAAAQNGSLVDSNWPQGVWKANLRDDALSGQGKPSRADTHVTRLPRVEMISPPIEFSPRSHTQSDLPDWTRSIASEGGSPGTVEHRSTSERPTEVEEPDLELLPPPIVPWADGVHALPLHPSVAWERDDFDELLDYGDAPGIDIRVDKDRHGTPMSMTANGRIQARYTYFEDQGAFQNPTMNDVEFERVQLGVRGHVYERYLRYNIGMNFDSDDAHVASLRQAYTEVQLDEAFDINFGDRIYLRGGLWRNAFGRQAGESSMRLQFVDRSLPASFFSIGTNLGLALRGEFTYDYRPVNYEIALLNGFGSGSNEPRDGLDDNFAVGGRLQHDLFGNYQRGESDNGLSPFAAMRIGGSFAATRRTRNEPDGARDEFDASAALLMASDDNNAVFQMDDLNGPEREYDLWLWGVDASWKHAGWSLHSEYFLRLINNVVFASPDTFEDFMHGFYIQGGYFLTEKMEVSARQSILFARGRGSGSPVPGGYDTSARETGMGLSFYFRGHVSKLQHDLIYYDGAPHSSGSINVQAGDVGLMLRSQYQLAF